MSRLVGLRCFTRTLVQSALKPQVEENPTYYECDTKVHLGVWNKIEQYHIPSQCEDDPYVFQWCDRIHFGELVALGHIQCERIGSLDRCLRVEPIRTNGSDPVEEAEGNHDGQCDQRKVHHYHERLFVFEFSDAVVGQSREHAGENTKGHQGRWNLRA